MPLPASFQFYFVRIEEGQHILECSYVQLRKVALRSKRNRKARVVEEAGHVADPFEHERNEGIACLLVECSFIGTEKTARPTSIRKRPG